MKKNVVQIMLVFHQHQPVGNFPEVFEAAFANCYQPLAEAIFRYPSIKAGLHFSGPLADWIDKHHPEYWNLIGLMSARNQIELIGGAYYEPVYPAIPLRDLQRQIALMAGKINERFGYVPGGAWLTERVWEPELPRSLAGTGVRYVWLDDTHFLHSGFSPDDMRGYYLTERAGHSLAVFPIHRRLRYLIPFRPVAEFMDFCNEYREKFPGCILTYGDDGEKFGVWPETHEWVYANGWLDEFLQTLTVQSAEIQTVLPREAIAGSPPRGRAYLGTDSYREMTIWALPGERSALFDKVLHAENTEAAPDGAGEYFLRGGLWDNFLRKYPETNRMHKKMLWLSGLLAVSRERMTDAQFLVCEKALLESQCNCAYWHGLFGGVYLNYLRHALDERFAVIESELRSLPEPPVPVYLEYDRDCDGYAEIIASTRTFSAAIYCHDGMTADDVTLFRSLLNLTSVASRQFEAYHDTVRKYLDEIRARDREAAQASADRAENISGSESGSRAPQSIHDRIKLKSPDIERHLVYDEHTRRCFRDRVLPISAADLTCEAMSRGDVRDISELTAAVYERTGAPPAAGGRIEVAGHAVTAFCRCGKMLAIHGEKIRAHWKINFRDPAPESLFTTDLNVSFLAQSGDRWFEVDGARYAMNESVVAHAQKIAAADGWTGASLQIEAPGAAIISAYPVLTVNQSEDGFETTYQGTCFTIAWALTAGIREFFAEVVMTIGQPENRRLITS